MDGFHTDDDLPVPSWARQLGRQGYNTFLLLIESYFRSRDIRIEIDRVAGLVRPASGNIASNSVFGLQNIAQACRQADRDEWRDLIAAHFDAIFDTSSDDNAFKVDMSDFARLRNRLRARLYPIDVINHAAEVVQRPGPEGTLEVLALDLPTTVRTVSRLEADAWHIDPDDLLDIGRQNLRNTPRLVETIVPLEQGTRFKVLSGDSHYAASHALFLDDYLPDDLLHGVLVGIPKRDVLLVHEIRDMGLMEAATMLLQIIIAMHHDGPGSLSPYLYWYRNGEFTVLPYEIDNTTLALLPPEEFAGVIEQLAELAELT